MFKMLIEWMLVRRRVRQLRAVVEQLEREIAEIA